MQFIHSLRAALFIITMKTEKEIKAKIDRIVDEIEEAERKNETLRVAGLYRRVSGLQWVLNG